MSTDTRENILRVTSQLLVTRGYGGTSTRDIAAAVGIRQPSLFHHFQSKRAIVTELLERDLEPAAARARLYAELSGPAGPRLYAYILADYRALATTTYDIRGIYTSALLDDPDFASYRARFDEFAGDLRRIIEQGIAQKEFREVRPAHAQQALAGLFYAAVWGPRWLSAEEAQTWPEDSAELILRGLLRRPSTFAQVKRDGESLLATVSRASAEPAGPAPRSGRLKRSGARLG
jgi:AcrR family transcriptional regulator